MKKRLISVVLIVLIVLSVGTVSVFAADDPADYEHAYIYVGDKAYIAEVGDIITYTAFLTSEKKFECIQACVAYESNLLKIVRNPSDDPDIEDYENESMICCPNLSNPVANLGYRDNAVMFNAVRVGGMNFKNGKELVTLQFEVTSNGRGAIELNILEMATDLDDFIVSYYPSIILNTDCLTLNEYLDAKECHDAPKAVSAPFISGFSDRHIYVYNELDWQSAAIYCDRYGYDEYNKFPGKTMRRIQYFFTEEIEVTVPAFKIVNSVENYETELLELPNDRSYNTVRFTGEYTEVDGKRVYEVYWDQRDSIELPDISPDISNDDTTPGYTVKDPVVSPATSACILFEDSLGWGDIYAWAVSDDHSCVGLGEWPGVACQNYVGNIYYTMVPADFDFIVFHSMSNGSLTVDMKNALEKGYNVVRLTGTCIGEVGSTYDAYWDSIENALADNGLTENYVPETLAPTVAPTLPVIATENVVNAEGDEASDTAEFVESGAEISKPSTDPTSATGAVADSDSDVVMTGDALGYILLSTIGLSTACGLVLTVIYKNRREDKEE